MDTLENYKKIARQARKTVLRLIYKAQTSHIGSNFSCVDLLTVLFEKADLDKDKIILSKGWAAATLYYFLWREGRITEKELNSYCQPGSKFIGLAEPIIPEIPAAGGSMTYGLPFGVGFALAKKFKEEKGTIYVIESDGGMQGGQTWEAIQIAAQHKLNNLFLIVDDNSLQAMGETKRILNIHPLDKKLRIFGWDVKKINGHNFRQIETALSLKTKKPLAIIAKTVKGYPISFMSGNNLYHYKNLSKKEYLNAL
ncbi:MAG: 1-deoxy-D-xylulose-5-phosphate synthase N-terminal domain-containing protein, partial [Patescibacteria group bacterium]|nr:1-deoxy-D-xylulose-5-phosphate synthase N-terminal domain-containing protein [Patescibacteria group bacterium]